MKSGIMLLLFAMVSVKATAALETEKVTLTFSESDFSLVEGEDGVLMIEPHKLAAYPEANEPGLPLFSTDVAIPGGWAYTTSSLQYNKRLIRSNVRVAQSPMPVPTDGSFVAASESDVTYDASFTYPSEACRYVSSSDWDDVSVLHFLSCPFVYDAEEMKLYFIDNIELDITLSNELPTGGYSGSCPNPSLLKSYVVNPDKVDGVCQNRKVVSSVASTEDRIDYVIITKQSLKASFEPLLQWKRTKGLRSKIITMEEINSEYSGNDMPLKLKNCLYDLYTNNSLRYVLLGGDDTVVPVRGCYGVVSRIEDFAIPTDLYYACFGDDFEWNKNGNDIYGETGDGVNLAQSIYVTRVPVRRAEDVDAFVGKLLEYEKNPRWTNRILMCGHKLFGYINEVQSDVDAKCDNLYSRFIQPYWSGERYKFNNTYTDFAGGANYDLTPGNLTRQLSEGYDFMDMMTHGGMDSWSMERGGSYSREHGMNQTNIGATIITTMACLTNAFDASDKIGLDPCLSESLIRNPSSGVVAYLGCSRVGWGFSGGTINGVVVGSSSLGTSLQYESHFYKNLFSSVFTEKNFGAIVAAAKGAMVAGSSFYNSSRWVQFGLNPIGDPEMPIYIEEPLIFDKMKVILSNGMATVNTGVPGCRICVMSADDNGASYYKVVEGAQSVSLSDLPTNSMVCVTKQGYIPKQCSICLIQDEALSGNNTYNYDIVKIGSSLTSQKTEGAVYIVNGKTTINASTITIEPETVVEKGAELILKIK